MRFLGGDWTEPQGLEFGGAIVPGTLLSWAQPAPQEEESGGTNEELSHSGPVALRWDPPVKELVTRSRKYLQAGSKRIEQLGAAVRRPWQHTCTERRARCRSIREQL